MLGRIVCGCGNSGRTEEDIVPGLEAGEGMEKHREQKGAECAEEQKDWSEQAK